MNNAQLNGLIAIIKKHKYSKDDLIVEAESLENYGENVHCSLFGYSASEIREAIHVLDGRKEI